MKTTCVCVICTLTVQPLSATLLASSSGSFRASLLVLEHAERGFPSGLHAADLIAGFILTQRVLRNTQSQFAV